MKKLLTLFLALIMSMTAFSAFGCGNKKDSKDPDDTLVIDIQIGGYGTKWLEDIRDAYVEKTGKTVTVTPLGSTTESESALLAGRTSTDIYFTMDPLMGHQYAPKTINGETYDCLLEDLTSFIENDKIDGEGVTIKDKINPQYLEYFKLTRLDGTQKIYTLPWAVGLLGIVKNNEVWQDGWKVPNTTDKFIDLLDTIKGDGYVPLTYSKDYHYYNYLLETFVAQYEGVENMEQLWNAKLPKDDPDYEDAIDKTFLAYYEGVQYAYEVMVELMQSEEVNGEVQSKYHYSVNSKDHIGTQTFFLNKDYKIAMMMSGDWIQNEMKDTFSNPDLEFIKTPVISALGDKLGITDDQLSAIIDYVDGVAEEPDFTSSLGFTKEEVIEKVREARNIVPTNANSMAFYIPAYSNAKDLAKDFIKFMLSDEGLAIYQSSLGYVLPYEYDWTSQTNSSKMTNFVNKAYNDFYVGKTLYPTEREKSEIFARSTLRLYDNHDKQFVVEFAKYPLDGTPAEVAEDYFVADYTEINRKWNDYKSSAGIR